MPKTRFIVLKFLVYAAIAILLAIVQNTPDLLLIGTAKPMLAAAFAVAVAMFEGVCRGSFRGLLRDALRFLLLLPLWLLRSDALPLLPGGGAAGAGVYAPGGA